MAGFDASVVIQIDADDKEAEQKLNELKAEAQKLNDALSKKKSKKSALSQELSEIGWQLDDAKAKLEELNSAGADSGALYKQSQEVSRLQAQFDAAAKESERLEISISRGERSLAATEQSAGEYAARLAGARSEADGTSGGVADAAAETERLSDAGREAEKRFNKLAKRISGLAKRVFVFTLITKALRNVREYVWQAIQTNGEAMQSIAKLKGALRTLAQPLLQVVIPAFTTLVNVITQVINAITQLVAKILGSSVGAYAESAKNLYDEQQALSGVGSAAKKSGKYLAAFDEINQIGDKDSGGGGGASGTKPDFTGMISDQLGAIVGLFVGAGLVALGAILAFSGANIPLGIGMMAIGAITMWSVISENWDKLQALLQGKIGTIMMILGGSLLALGAIHAFSGVNIPLGLGLMIGGAAFLAAPVAARWEAIANALGGTLNAIVTIVSAAAIAVGAIMLISGANIPLGLGLLAAGLAGMAAIAPKWSTMLSKLKGPISQIVALISGALLVTGAVLLFTGANIPLGLGLLAAGAVGLGASIAANWQTVVGLLRGPIGAVAAVVGASLLVLGAILTFSGANVPLGLGLMAAGGVSLAAAIAPNWNLILDKIRGAWTSIKAFWNAHIAKVFTADFWKEKAKDMLNGFIGALESGINFILRGVASLVNSVTGLINYIPGVNIPTADWGNVTLPRLAQGAVIPPNREFLAVLGDQKSGTNIETPLSTMVQAFKQALSESGYGNQSEAQLVLDGQVLGRIVYKLNKAETNRIGVNLVEG